MSDSETITVTLKKPVKFNGQSYENLSFREVEVRDLIGAEEGAERGPTAYLAATLAGMAEVPIGVIELLKGRDMKQIIEATRDLRGNSPEEDGATG